MGDFRQEMLHALGSFPQKVDLYCEIHEETEESDHIRQRISYFVESGERIESLLLIPKRPRLGKVPGVFACHQHNAEFHLGKSEVAGLAGNPDMAYGVELCRRGYVVLCQDLFCFEDRRMGRFFSPHYDRDCTMEKICASYYVAEGRCLNTKYIHDMTVGIDVLTSLDFVDADRIGVIGHSTGGQEALWLCWMDERVKVGVSSCGFARISDLRKTLHDHNLAMTVPGIMNIGDMDDLLIDMAPKPFLFTNGTTDPTFPIDSCREIARRVGKHYNDIGAGDCLQPIIFEGGHAFQGEVKETAYCWLDRFLMEDKPDEEKTSRGGTE